MHGSRRPCLLPQIRQARLQAGHRRESAGCKGRHGGCPRPAAAAGAVQARAPGVSQLGALPAAGAERCTLVGIRLPSGRDARRVQVLYIDLVKDEGLQQLESVARVVSDLFRLAGLLGEEGRAFTAHLTVAKASAAAKRGKRRRTKGLPQVGRVYVPAGLLLVSWRAHACCDAGGVCRPAGRGWRLVRVWRASAVPDGRQGSRSLLPHCTPVAAGSCLTRPSWAQTLGSQAQALTVLYASG